MKEIAGLAGYDSQATFGRAFKRWAGVPPVAYRQLPSGDSNSRDAHDAMEGRTLGPDLQRMITVPSVLAAEENT